MAVWEAGSARTTKHSVDLLFGIELGNVMESYVLYLFLGVKGISIPTAKLSRVYCWLKWCRILIVVCFCCLVRCQMNERVTDSDFGPLPLIPLTFDFLAKDFLGFVSRL